MPEHLQAHRRTPGQAAPTVGMIRAGKRVWSEKAKGGKGAWVPLRLDNFRITSSEKDPIEAVAAIYGGQVEEWDRAEEDRGIEWQVEITSPLEVWFTKRASNFRSGYEFGLDRGETRYCNGERYTLSSDPASSGQPCYCAAAMERGEISELQCEPNTLMWVEIVGLEGQRWLFASGGKEVMRRWSDQMGKLWPQVEDGARVRLGFSITKATTRRRSFKMPWFEPLTVDGSLVAGEAASPASAPADDPAVAAKAAEGALSDTYKELQVDLRRTNSYADLKAWSDVVGNALHHKAITEQEKVDLFKAGEARSLTMQRATGGGD